MIKPNFSVRSAVLAYLNQKERESKEAYEAKGHREPKLWASNLGKCPRKAIMRIEGYEDTIDLPLRVREVMRAGVMWEEETEKALLSSLSGSILCNEPLDNEFWSGKADFIILGHKPPIIVEHKATGGKWFDFQKSLPKNEHILQLCLYGYLYELIFEEKPILVLFYRAFGEWAEFVVEPQENTILVEGKVSGYKRSNVLDVDFHGLRKELEGYYVDRTSLPPRLKDMKKGCLFKKEPSCQYFHHCWPDWNPE